MYKEKKAIRVLIVDDSSAARESISRVLSEDPMIEIMNTATDPFDAVQKIQVEVPDVITLDIEMPKMDGLMFLKRIMAQNPIPVVIISSLTAESKDTALKALEYGAVEIIDKPQDGAVDSMEGLKYRLQEVVKLAAATKYHRKAQLENMAVSPKNSADVILLNPASEKRSLPKTETVVLIGASAGGTDALRLLLMALPPHSPGIVIVQHMPEKFTKLFADQLNEQCEIAVKEAEDGDLVINGRALIARGNKHILLKRKNNNYYVELIEGPLVNRHRPSVDVLFRSAAQFAGQNAIGVILTGMGDDGARGLFEMQQAGSKTIAQNEETSVVFGMPQVAIKLNAAEKILPLDLISDQIIRWQNKL